MSDLPVGWYELLFGIRRSIRYHRRRAHFFDMWGKWTNGLNVVFGSTAAASVISASGFLAPGHEGCAKLLGALSGVIVAIISTVDIIVGSSVVARDHADLARRFIALEGEMTLAEAKTEKTMAEFMAKRLVVEADEPDIMRMLDVICHNDLARAEGQPREQMFKVGWLKRRLAQLINFDTQNVETLPAASSPVQKQLPA